jgi:hypothetical protein
MILEELASFRNRSGRVLHFAGALTTVCGVG